MSQTLFRYRIEKCKDDPQGAADFISGMTDRFALQLFQDIYIHLPGPREGHISQTEDRSIR